MSDVNGFNTWRHKETKTNHSFSLPATNKSKPNLRKGRARRTIENLEEQKQLSNEFDYLEK